MARKPRMYSDSGTYFVTVRVFQAMRLLAPSAHLNRVVGGVLARAVALTGVRLHAFVALSNHVHLLISAEGQMLSRCMQYFLGNTSKKVGALLDWRGSFWESRFSAVPILDDEALIERLRYLLSHGVKEGLVRLPGQWPGLTCLPLLLSEEPHLFPFFHWSRRWHKGSLLPLGKMLWSPLWSEEIELKLTPLPCWAGLSRLQRQSRVRAMVHEIVVEGLATHKTVKGVAAILAQKPKTVPRDYKRTRQPPCHAHTPTTRHEYLSGRCEWLSAFMFASRLFRAGQWSAKFPSWAFRPIVPLLQV